LKLARGFKVPTRLDRGRQKMLDENTRDYDFFEMVKPE
jgi:hypothetical protein